MWLGTLYRSRMRSQGSTLGIKDSTSLSSQRKTPSQQSRWRRNTRGLKRPKTSSSMRTLLASHRLMQTLWSQFWSKVTSPWCKEEEIAALGTRTWRLWLLILKGIGLWPPPLLDRDWKRLSAGTPLRSWICWLLQSWEEKLYCYQFPESHLSQTHLKSHHLLLWRQRNRKSSLLRSKKKWIRH